MAYSFGLRHAFDVDHIAAIDNTVRKLVRQRTDASGVGLFFSFGHSTVVLLLAVATGTFSALTEKAMPHLREAGAVLGSWVSGGFLLLIGLVNLGFLVNSVRAYALTKQSDGLVKMEDLTQSGGLLMRIIGPVLSRVNRSWHMYPVGFLFGLGFDTASEVSLLTLSAMVAAHGLRVWGLLSLPLLFAAGMSLMDSTDSWFMSSVYELAVTNPLGKLYYDLFITGLSVLVALFVGLIEVAQAFAQGTSPAGSFWRWVQGLSLSHLGYWLVGVFGFAWLFAYVLMRGRRVDESQTRQTGI